MSLVLSELQSFTVQKFFSVTDITVHFFFTFLGFFSSVLFALLICFDSLALVWTSRRKKYSVHTCCFVRKLQGEHNLTRFRPKRVIYICNIFNKEISRTFLINDTSISLHHLDLALFVCLVYFYSA
jgi:hypothetical protein